jgi:hypothetical protein
VRDFVNAQKVGWKTIGLPTYLPKQTDLVTFIAHKWKDDIPYSEENKRNLIQILSVFHPDELIWVDFITEEWKTAIVLADYVRWISSCHTRVVISDDIQKFCRSYLWIAEFLISKPSYFIGNDEDRIMAYLEGNPPKAAILEISQLDSDLKVPKRDICEFLQCLALALTDKDIRRARLAKQMIVSLDM